MATFNEVNQIRLGLKMKLSNYAWYCSSSVVSIDNDFGILVEVNHIDNAVRKVVPPVIEGVCVKVEAK